ncbi:DUF3027 domain-containing protein [Amycolatopsis sp. NPDC051128]|uniref:DUF3027 domain-containing protein n=1 Tax=Amycolatopsis sp. NPDC051128 TaxID=3155412 RepID=UPI0034341874
MTLLLTLDDGSVQRKLADAVGFARAAVLEHAPAEQLGAHVGVTREDAVTASHLFEAQVPGYGGWRWSVTVALAGDDEPVTVSEVVLVPGPDALVAPPWVPWERRVRAGDLGVGDIFPTDENDPRLAPAYLQSDDPAVEEVAHEAGLGRVHVLSRLGRSEAAARWHGGEFGPRSDMARSAPDVCGTCGFFVPLAGSLRGVFGVCSNDIAPADGHVVDVEYGCGAHSEVEVELTSSVPVAELVYDDSLLDYTPAPSLVETPAAEPETAVTEADLSPAEVEPEVAAEPVVAEVPEPVVAEPVVAEVPEPAEAEPTQAEVTDAVAEPAEAVAAPAEVAGVVAEPEPAVAEEPQLEAADVPAEPQVAAEPDAAEVTEVVAEPVAAESDAAEVDPIAAGVVAEEPAQAEVTEVPAEPEVSAPGEAGVAESAEAEPVQAEVAESENAEVSAPAEADVAAEPEPAQAGVPEAVVEPVAVETSAPVEADVAEAAGAEPAQAEVPEVPVEPVAAETPAAPVEADVAEPAEAEPTQAEVTEAAAEPPVAEAELPEATLTDNVVTEAGSPEPSLTQPDEAQTQVDTAAEDVSDQRDA